MKPANFYLIRGLAREAAHWGGFSDLLKKQNYVKQVFHLDLPGAGKFHKLTSPISIRETAEFMLSQIDFSVEGPKVIFSISLGSMVAIEMVQRQGDQFDKLYVINTSFSNLSPLHHRLQLRALKRFGMMAKARKDTMERELEALKMVSHNREVWQELAEQFVEVEKQRPFQVKNLFRQLVAAATYRIAKDKPVTPMVVFNSLGDEMVHPSCSEKLARHWDLPIYTHPEAGHDMAIDAPEWLIKKVAETL